MAAGEGEPLRVTTRTLATGEAHRYVLSWARVNGDSLVGVVFEEHERDSGGRWSAVPQGERERRIAVATADIAEVSRREREPSDARTAALIIGAVGVFLAAYWGFLYVASAG